MYQFLRLNNPIPSCELYSLEFIENKWIYIYALNTPFELNDDNTVEIAVYEYISDLYLKVPDSIHPESVNLKITKLSEYMHLLKKQMETDLDYRKKWLSKLDDVPEVNSITLENKTYSHQDLLNSNLHYISFTIEFNDKYTKFAAI